MRLLDECAVIPIIEAKDYGSAGITADCFTLQKANSCGIIMNFGAITGNSTLLIYSGATLAATTTALAYRYRQTGAVFKTATLADVFSAATAQTATALTLTDTTFKNTTLVIDLDANEVSVDTQPYITVVVSSTATVLLMSAFAILGLNRYAPALTNIV